MTTLTVYPDRPSDRTRWIESFRGLKNQVSADVPYAAIVEEELGPDLTLWPTATLFLTNRECPFRCLMCDLWKNTLDETISEGAIPTQIDRGLATLAVCQGGEALQLGKFFRPSRDSGR